MRIVSIPLFLIAVVVFWNAKSAIHEILATLIFLSAITALGTGQIVVAIKNTKDQ